MRRGKTVINHRKCETERWHRPAHLHKQFAQVGSQLSASVRLAPWGFYPLVEKGKFVNSFIMRPIGIRYLRSGGLLFEDSASQSLFYRRQKGGKAYEVSYSVGTDEAYVLARLIKAAGESGETPLPPDEAGTVLAEVRRLLAAEGFAVSISEAPVGVVAIAPG